MKFFGDFVLDADIKENKRDSCPQVFAHPGDPQPFSQLTPGSVFGIPAKPRPIGQQYFTTHYFGLSFATNDHFCYAPSVFSISSASLSDAAYLPPTLHHFGFGPSVVCGLKSSPLLTTNLSVFGLWHWLIPFHHFGLLSSQVSEPFLPLMLLLT